MLKNSHDCRKRNIRHSFRKRNFAAAKDTCLKMDFLSDSIREAQSALQAQGKASILLAKDGACIGIIALSDVLRTNASDIVAKLHEMGQNCFAYGRQSQHRRLFRKASWYYCCSRGAASEEKVENIAKLQQEGNTVCDDWRRRE